MQKYLAGVAEKALREKLKTEVRIDRLEIGLFNRVILHDVDIKDRKNLPLLSSSLMSAKIEYRALLEGRVSLRSVSLLDGNINFYKEKKDSATNFQFVIDAFKSKSKGPSHLNLTLNSIIIRRLNFAYNELFALKTPKKFNTSHLQIQDINTNISLKTLTNDSINLRVRNLDFKELCGFNVKAFTFRLAANRKHTAITKFDLQLPHSHFSEDELQADYDLTDADAFIKTITLHGQVKNAKLAISDIACFEPKLKDFPYTITLSGQFDIKPNAVRINQIQFQEEKKRMSLNAHAYIQRKDGAVKRINGAIDNFFLAGDFASEVLSPLASQKNLDIVKRLGDINLKANGFFDNEGIKWVNADIKSGIGNLYGSVHWRDNSYMAQVSSTGLDITKLLDNASLPNNVIFHADLKADVLQKKLDNATASILIDNADFLGYSYKNLKLNANVNRQQAQLQMSINDPSINVSSSFQGAFNGKELTSLKGILDVKRLNAEVLNLDKQMGRATYMGEVQITIPNIKGEIRQGELLVSNFFKLPHNPEENPYHLNLLQLELTPSSRGTLAHLASDFAHVDIDGHLSLPLLKDNIQQLIACALPSLSSQHKKKDYSLAEGLTKGNKAYSEHKDNQSWTVSAQILRPDFFQSILNIPIDFEEKIDINGCLSSCGERSALLVYTPKLSFGSTELSRFRCYVQGVNGNLNALVQGAKKFGDSNIKFAINTKTQDGQLHSTVNWDDGIDHRYKGELSALSNFSRNWQGNLCVNTQIMPTQFTMADTLWHIAPSRIDYDGKQLHVNNFSLNHEDQSLGVNGILSSHATDSLQVRLNKIEVSYILSLISLKPVSFAGKATGFGYLFPNASGHLRVKAKIHLPEFYFNDGLMGDAIIDGAFSSADKRLHLKADIQENGVGSTFINGYVGIGEKALDLHVISQNTTLVFLRRYMPDIFSNINGRTTGRCRVFGPFKEIDFEGNEQANIYATVNPIGTSYHLADGMVNIRSGIFSFENYEISDDQGGRGQVYGTLQHNHLKNIRYDFTANTQKLLIYNRGKSIDMPFYATATGTGQARLYGKPGAFSADIDMQPNDGTLLVYTVDNPDTGTDVSLLQFRSKILKNYESVWTPKDTCTEFSGSETNSINHLAALQDSISKNIQKDIVLKAKSDEDEGLSSSTDINLNFRFDMNPAARLRVVTDTKTGDNITLAGTGAIRATYYNKGNFQMFGTYTVERGLYKMVIQDVIHKDFQLQQGGNIIFTGDPFEADLNLKAIYTIPSVSLADLGFNFADKSVRADCILNLGGKAGALQVTFGLNLPTVSDDVKQMVKQLIATDEDMNRQILYLLGVGRFYNYNYAATDAAADGQSQSSVAMKSFLSNTLSGQLNNIISNAMGVSNWTFGANLSTGQIGWSDMEVGGSLSGRLLNNRLQVNGMFGYRERPTSTTNFVGDFDINYLLTPSGSVSLKAYSETNDRYFSKSSMTTQGVGILLKHDFKNIGSLFKRKKKNRQIDRKH